ncbi:MAG: translation elongation factor Ts [Rhodospirillaceae bacterium]|jgi:elongation factor Ts|nr:translation elongation factor Ts [Rhodospirillaceae bacterium]
MAQITAALVKELREKSGAGMMDCKKALSETDGDIEAAIDWLRKKGLSAAAKKSGRVAAEGLIGVAVDGTKGAILEVNAETDFVARNDIFQGFVEAATNLSLGTDGDLEALKTVDVLGEGRNVQDQVIHLVATIGENMQLRRSEALSVSKGVVAAYMHSAVKAGLGKIGVLVALESEGDTEKLTEFGKQLAMHIAAASPRFLTTDGVDAVTQARERQVLTDQAKESGRPDEVIEKMVDGRMRKFFEEVVLLEQVYVISEDKSKVSKVIEAKAEELGSGIKLAGFVRFALGEGIEREEKDFAAEVAEAVGG